MSRSRLFPVVLAFASLLYLAAPDRPSSTLVAPSPSLFQGQLIAQAPPTPAPTPPVPPKPTDPYITLPATAKGRVGRYIHVKASTNLKSISWFSLSPDLTVEAEIVLKNPNAILVLSEKAGVYYLEAVGAANDQVLRQLTTVTVVDAAPVPPGPVPPGPVPPGPTPPAPPAPIPAQGLHVLIITDGKSATSLPPAQQQALFAANVRQYLNDKCVPDTDGNTKAWRIWPKDVDAAGESQLWQDALKRPAKSYPWIVVSDGKTGFEGPLPANADSLLTLLKKYGG